jgi:3-hydroxyacyl-CoA dehydrogenase
VSLDRPAHQLVATVIGAGTMGAQIAAHLANAGVRTHLLDIVPRDAKPRDALARGALASMGKAKPAPFMNPEFSARITPGNIDDHLEAAVRESDLVIEAVIERLDIKKPLFDRIAKAAPQHAILATNTSGLPIGAIAADLPEAARKRVVGMHFFNPPRYMHLLEVVASDYTDPAVVAAVSRFSDHVLGKGVVPCRDTPNFIANRVGVAEMLLTFGITFDDGYTVEEVDLLNGKLMGRPKMGSFRLGDLVGLDVAALVIGNLQRATSSDPKAPNYDELHDRMQVHPQLETMFERGMKGDKTGQGFYKKTDARNAKGQRVVLTLDLKTLEYRDRIEPKFPELDKIARMPLPARVAAAMRVEGRAGDFLRKLWLPLFAYAANRLGEICDSPKEIDDAMRWGYAWTLGPFELWDAVGVKWAVEQMQAGGVQPAPAVRTLLATAGDDAKWYGGSKSTPSAFVPARKAHVPIPATPGIIVLDQLRDAGKVIERNDSATLLDLGDGIACVEFHSKMNSLGQGVLEVLGKAVPTAKARGMRGVVVGNQGENFSVGADAFMILALAGQSKWKELDEAVNTFQQTLMSLRHGELPVVVAPHGMALGGGCELTMHGAAAVAAAESYIGLVEIGVGLLPAGGGLKEIVRRASEWAAQAPEGDPYPWVRRGFEKVAQAAVATSAHESRKAGWLRNTDRIVFNKDRVIAEAKRVAIGLAEAGWVPPDRGEPIQVVGASRGASFLLGAQLFEWGGYASAHDKLIGEKIAHVLSGGMSVVPRTVTAQDLLDLEREAFVSLCGEQKTRDRIAHMLSTGKPLRN